MHVTRCELEGLLIIEPKVFGDSRGYFLESWNQKKYAELGISASFVQDNISVSRRGTLRGLHFQNPFAQGKLVSVLQGEVFDVAVDIRRDSPTFRRWEGTRLSSDNRRQFYIPPGFAHGFQVLSETAMFHYKCTEFYSPADELAIRWNDPEIGIVWPLGDQPALSAKDTMAPLLKEIPSMRLFD